ncbi:hypothetical protein BKE38_15535 [Pseudoroseomonas deserti]|uniref:HTH lysR-type domain-containing protein n=1 Tax=Teichococcus deserti TaxID=1817963 RepID=A0A1V2H093_9PROT|nr:LysR substrate-binding domain-containing protein [Pseudoroseomonas deserti]ONG51780.1 hypothetical protein BKE38_15535 [Pseudoroseomonas deserti]
MIPPLPPLAALRAFAAVARAGSFARAATQLHVSTSAVSHQIRGLEAQLGTPLLTRARNGAGHSQTAPTAAGQTLLEAVEAALTMLAESCAGIRAEAGRPRARLVVCANGSVASLWLAPRLAAFAGLHPSVDWHMRAVEAGSPDLAAEGIDLAILRARTGQIPPGDSLLFEERMFPVASPAVAAEVARLGRSTALARLSLLEEEHSADSPDKDWRHWLAHLGEAVPAPRLIRFSGFNQAIGAALAGAGIALGRSPLLDAELAAGRLVRLFAPEALAGTWVFTLRLGPAAARDPHVRQLSDFLRTPSSG